MSLYLASFNAYGFLSPIPWITNNRIRTDLDINASANQQTSQLIHLKIYSSWTILSLITINITLFDQGINGPAIPAYDGATGGTYPLSAYIGTNFNPSGTFKVLWFLQAGYSISLVNEFCFVPTASALDVTTFDASSLTAVYVDAISPANPSRLGKFIAQEAFSRPNTSTTVYNEAHIRYTARNGQWIFNEMENPGTNTVHCTSECPVSGLSISGPELLCSTATYAISPTLAGAAFSWASSNGSVASIDASSGAAAFVSRGPATISTSINGCSISGLTKAIWVGTPKVDYFTANSQTSIGSMCLGNSQYIETHASGSPTYFHWFISSGNAGNAYLTDYSNGSASFNTYTADCYGLTLDMSNGCGTSSDGVSICANNCFSAYKIYPNPAKNYLSVEFEKAEQAESLPDRLELFREHATKPIQSIDVQDAYRSKALKQGNILEFTVKELPRGTYYLHVVNSRRKDKSTDSIRILLE
ncbi:hypothetical protein [Spirosoma jeollabukense]